MTERLHDLLEKVADDAPAPRVDRDLFTRAQRARRRDRTLLAGSVLGLVLLVLAGVSFLPGGIVRQDRVGPVGSPDAPAMPATVYPVPEHVNLDARETDLAVGPVAAAFYDTYYEPVLVSAVDGSYHRMRLPGQGDHPGFEGGSMALSPDGRQLAFGWHAPLPEVSGPHVESGIAVADLETGEVRRFSRPGGKGVRVEQIAFSPQGRYLAYGVKVRTVWDEGQNRSRTFYSERLDLRTGKVVRVPLQAVESAPAVDDRGRVAVAQGGFAGWWDPRHRPRVTRLDALSEDGLLSTAAWSPTGRRLAFGAAAYPRGGRTAVTAPDAAAGIVRVGSRGANFVNGWLDDSHVVVLHAPEDSQTSSLQVVSVTDGRTRTAVDVEGHWSNGYSFATDLLARPTRDFAEPDWPVDWQAVASRALVGLGLLVAAFVALSAWRRLRGRRAAAASSS